MPAMELPQAEMESVHCFDEQTCKDFVDANDSFDVDAAY